MREKEVVLKKIDHEFSYYTRRLMETVSVLLKSIEKVRKDNGDVAKVGKTMDNGDVLMKRADGIIDEALRVKKESEKLLWKGAKEKVKKSEESVDIMESEYNKLWERIDEIDNIILNKETTTLSFWG